jgi:hypothetical protein
MGDLTVVDLESVSRCCFEKHQSFTYIQDTVRSSSQASLDQAVISVEVVRIKGSAKVVVEQELPSDRKTEDIEAIIIDEMLHL